MLEHTASGRSALWLQSSAPITDAVIETSQPPTTTAVGDLIWFDADNDGSFDADEQGLNNVILALYPAGASVEAAPFMTTTSSALDGRDGRYLFSNVPPGEYFIHIPATQFQPDGPLNGLVSTGPTAGDPNDNEDEDAPASDNGLNNGQPAQNGISSGSFQLTLGDEPTGENVGDAPAAWDNYDNLTIDFGFYRPLQIGN
ncbi:MAG: hypothetical protein KDE50_36465, partial [Caldilineaceae bacterium]|nr:hypothetical protein [Caldilineaceae bacterium]